MFIDSHAHLNSSEFKENWKNAVTEAKNAGLSGIINIGSDLVDSEWGSQQANQEPIVCATIGIHPEHLQGHAPDMGQAINNLRRLIDRYPKIVGIGELGLDYTLDPDLAPKQAQIDLIRPQLALAIELNLPIVMHVRDQKGSQSCFNDTIKLFQEYTTSKPATNAAATPTTHNPQPTTQLAGVFHCWTGTPDQARQALDLGFYISFSGILTYKSAGHIVDAARIVPDDRLLIETDSPYLTPEPARSKEHPAVNEPKYVILTAEKLASIRQTNTNHIAEVTANNVRRLFKLDQ